MRKNVCEEVSINEATIFRVTIFLNKGLCQIYFVGSLLWLWRGEEGNSHRIISWLEFWYFCSVRRSLYGERKHTHNTHTHHTHTRANTILKINLYENCKIRVTRFQHNHAKESFMLCAQLYCSAHDFDCESQMKTICMTAGSKIYHTALFILRFTLYRQCLVEVVVSWMVERKTRSRHLTSSNMESRVEEKDQQCSHPRLCQSSQRKDR